MYVGTQQQYNAEAILEDGTQYDVTSSVVWSEPNNFINSQGYLTAKFATNTSITATLGALSGSTNLTVVSASLQSIAISPINPTVGIGIPLQFTATGTFSDGGSQDITAEATWFSSDTKIATINNPFTSSGITTPLTVGSTNITASLNGVTSFSTTLNVVPKTLDSIQISPTNTTIPLGVKQQFTATGIYSDGSTEDITYDAVWASSATNVATIGNAENNSGLATPLTNGSTNITASLDGVTSAISTLTISNATIQSVQISPTNPKIYLGSEQQFTATGIYSDGSTEDITNQATWTSSQTNIATISNFTGNEGLATPLALGSTNITATFNGKVSLASTLTVSNATLQSIQISPINPSTSINTPIQMKAIGIYSDGGNQEITTQVEWASSQTAVAIISNAIETNGLVTPIAAGTTNITASLNGVTSSASALTVNSITLTSIAITPITATAELGTFEQYTAIGTYSDGSTQNITNSVTWISSQISIATISNANGTKGLATPVAAGTTNITASLNGVTSNTATLSISSATLTSIAITPTNAVAELGTFEQYTAIGTYSDGKTENITNDVTWASSQISIATISNSAGSEGLATPIAAGTTNITATLNGVTSNTVTLRVDAATLISITITPGNSTLDSNDTLQFTAIGTYSDGDTENITNNVTWTSSQTGVVAISNVAGSKGLATALTPGTANITASLNGVTSSASVLTINSVSLSSIAVTPTNSTIKINGTQQFTAIGTYSDSSTKNITAEVTWTSSQTSFATISNLGVATGIAAGNSTITAALGGVSGNTTATVIPPRLYIVNKSGGTLVRCDITSLGTLANCSVINSYGRTSQRIALYQFNDTTLKGYVSLVTGNIDYCDINIASGSAGECFIRTVGTDTNSPNGVGVSGNYFYAFLQATNEIKKCTINPANGLISNCVNSGADVAGGNGVDLATNNGYVYTTNNNVINRCIINQVDGTLSSCLSTGTGVTFDNLSGITFSNGYAYFARSGGGLIYRCSINTSNGLLNSCGDSGATNLGGNLAGLASYGNYIFVSYNTFISSCEVNPITGVLSNCGSAAGTNLGNPVGMASW